MHRFYVFTLFPLYAQYDIVKENVRQIIQKDTYDYSRT